MTQPAAHDDPKSLLDAVNKTQRRTREKLRPGFIDFVALLLSQQAAALVSGAYGSTYNGLYSAGLVVVTTYSVLSGYRTRRRLGGRVRVATWLAPAGLFAVDVVIGLTLHGNAQDSLMILSIGVATIALAPALHERYFAEMGALMAAIGIASAFHAPPIVYVGLTIFCATEIVLKHRKSRTVRT